MESQEKTQTNILSYSPFAMALVIVFLLSYGLLYSIDLVPEPVAEVSQTFSYEEDESTSENIVTTPLDDSPRRILIDAIGVDATINNPVSRDINTLDRSLQSGVVHYPGSGDLEDHSNMFLFGHSSFLPTVQNEWYRVFNNLSKLEDGDMIRMQADGYEYRYIVRGVDLVNAEDALVELSNREKKLTLSTCNSFGAKDERFVVEADYLERVKIAPSSA